MIPCASAGLEPGWRCQIRCLHCYYVRDPRLGTKEEKSLDQLKQEVLDAKARGCNRVYYVGQGEPTLYPGIVELTQFATEQHMGSSVITNGLAGIKKYEALYAAGLDHPHISMHGVGEVLTQIADTGLDAGKKQDEFMQWLHKNNLPFRTNSTVQKLNYKTLPDIARKAIGYGVKHFVVLGFLPHYDWIKYLTETAVPINESAPFVEQTSDIVLDAGRLLTLRYQPHCVLKPKYWPYIVNARYVPFDPWEWENNHHDFDIEKVWKFAIDLGNQVAVRGKPCDGCAAHTHCGGWNKVFAGHHDHGGKHLRTLTNADIPAEWRHLRDVRGGLHDLNPANAHCGFLRQETIDNVAKLNDDPFYGSALKGKASKPPRLSLPVLGG